MKKFSLLFSLWVFLKNLTPVFNLQKFFSLLMIFFLLTAGRDTFAAIHYVKAGATGTGATWNDASGDLQSMINASATGDQVWVAAGTYKPAGSNRDSYFLLKEGVAVYGGFSSTDYTFSNRNVTAYTTILSGDIGEPGINSDNCYHVLISVNNSNSTILDGFAIKDGNANGGSGVLVSGNYIVQQDGGGIYNNISSPTISNCTFTANSCSFAGSAIYNTSSSPIVKNCRFLSNNGSAVCFVSSSSAVVTNCLFALNVENQGASAGLVASGSSPTVTNCTFSANNALFGSGIGFAGSSSVVTNCIFWDNNSQSGSNNQYSNSSIFINTGSPTFRNCIIQGGGYGNTNINSDPLFVDASNGNYLLKPNSPALNIGDNAVNDTKTDLVGNQRKFGVIDLGAYEYQCNPTIITSQPQNASACNGSSAKFTVGVTGPNLTYKWYQDGILARSGNNSTTLTINNITDADAGNYTVDIISDCGTVTSNGAALTVNSAPTPEVTVVNNCGSSTLSTTAPGTLLWSTDETSSSVTVSNAGTYTVTQTISGCTSAEASADAAPKTIPSAPVVTVKNNCGSSTLSTTASGSLLWSTSETGSSIDVSNAGTYTVTRTINGCTSSDAGEADASPKAVPSAPSISVTNNCGSSTLSTTASGNLLWSTNETSSSIDVSNAGTYTVTRTVNGCTGDAGKGDAAPKTAPFKPIVTANGSVNFCQGGSVTLSAPSGFASYKWSNNATTPTINVNQSGSYSVVVTNAGGCSSPSSDAITVTAGNDTQKPDITCPAAVTLCYAAAENYTIASLQATDNCGIASISYTISGATTRSGSGVNASGKFSSGTSTITWIVKDGNGNTSTCQSNVNINEKFTVSIPDGWALGSGCTLNTVYKGYTPASYILLIAKPSGGKSPFTYKWSNGSTAAFILVNPDAATTYTVTIKDAKGCTQSASKQISVVDVRCGSKMDKVTLCYKGNTLCSEQKDVANYLLKGAYLGSCKGKNAASKEMNEMVEKEVTEQNDLAVKASPNPSSAYFKLTVNSSNIKDKVSISIVDEVGRAVETKTATAGRTLQIGDFYRPGIYFVKAMQANKIASVKLIKQ